MDECLFCKIIRGAIPSEKVYEDEAIVAFKDINPQAPVHILIIPKKHIPSVTTLTEDDTTMVGRIHLVACQIAKDKSCHDCGFRMVVNSGPDAGQAVDHLHFHVLGGRKLKWPPG